MSVYITEIEISNLGGISHYTTSLTHQNYVLGRNGSGKTSFKDAVDFGLSGGDAPDLLRIGADEGYVQFRLTNGFVIKKMLMRDKKPGYKPIVTTPDGGEQKAPMTFIRDLLPEQSFNVDDFLKLKMDKQIEYLLTIMPITFTAEEVNAALYAKPKRAEVIAITDRAKKFLAANQDARAEPSLVSGEISLERFDAIYNERYSQRTNLNRLRDQVRGAVATFRSGLMNDDSHNWTAERERLELELAKIKTQIGSAQAAIKLESEQMRTAKREEIRGRRDKLQIVVSRYLTAGDAWAGATKAFAAGGAPRHQEWVNAHKVIVEGAVTFADTVGAILDADQELSAYLQNVDAGEAKSILDETSELEATRARLAEELGTARAKSEEQQREAGRREAIELHEEQIKAMNYNEEDISMSLKKLEELKIAKLQSMPIPGFDIKFADKKAPVITIDGVNFLKINQQGRIFTAVRIFRMSRPELPLLILESAELDTDSMDELVEKLADLGCQVVCPRHIPGADLDVVHSHGEYLHRLNEANVEREAVISARDKT